GVAWAPATAVPERRRGVSAGPDSDISWRPRGEPAAGEGDRHDLSLARRGRPARAPTRLPRRRVRGSTRRPRRRRPSRSEATRSTSYRAAMGFPGAARAGRAMRQPEMRRLLERLSWGALVYVIG